jgi:hypothetical protein
MFFPFFVVCPILRLGISLLMIEIFLQALSQSLKGLSVSTRCVRRWGMRGSLLIRRKSKFLPHNVPVLSIDIPISREHSLLSSSANFVPAGQAVNQRLAVSGRDNNNSYAFQLLGRTLPPKCHTLCFHSCNPRQESVARTDSDFISQLHRRPR